MTKKMTIEETLAKSRKLEETLGGDFIGDTRGRFCSECGAHINDHLKNLKCLYGPTSFRQMSGCTRCTGGITRDDRTLTYRYCLCRLGEARERMER